MLNMDKGSSVVIMGNKVPLVVAGAVLGAGSLFLADALHAVLLSHISADKKLARMESAVVSAGAGGAGYALVAKLANENLVGEAGLQQLLMVGAASSIVSQYIYENFVLNLIDDKYSQLNL